MISSIEHGIKVYIYKFCQTRPDYAVFSILIKNPDPISSSACIVWSELKLTGLGHRLGTPPLNRAKVKNKFCDDISMAFLWVIYNMQK